MNFSGGPSSIKELPLFRHRAHTFAFLRVFLALLVLSCQSSDDIDNFFGPSPGGGGGGNENPVGYTLNSAGGTTQSGPPSTTFSELLRIQLLKDGLPAFGEVVNFFITSGSGSLNKIAVVTDLSGLGAVSFTSGVSAGTTMVRATYAGMNVDFTMTVIEQTGTELSISSGNNQSADVGSSLPENLVVNVERSADGLPASGILVEFIVILGNGRINGSTSTFQKSSDGNGQAGVNFSVGTIAGINTITVRLPGNPAAGNVTFSATGEVPPDSQINPIQTAVTVAPDSHVADGASTSLITLITRDVYGNQIPAGGALVDFGVDAGTLLSVIADHGDGSYTQSIRVPTDTSTNPITISGTIDGQDLSSAPASLTLRSGNIDLSKSTVTTGVPSLTADGLSSTLVTVTLKDVNNNQLTTGGETVVIVTTLGTLTSSVIDSDDGTYVQTIQAPTSSGIATISATVGGSSIVNNGSISFLPGLADPLKSLINATPSIILPNGISTSTIMVMLRDQHGNPLSTGGDVVQLTKDNGTWNGSALDTVIANDEGDGTYTRTLISAPSSGQAMITGTLNAAAMDDIAAVYFSDASSGPSTLRSEVDISGGTLLPADNSSTTLALVTLKDADGNQIENGGSSVVIFVTGGTLLASVQDNGDGTYQQLLRAAATPMAAVEVSATVDGGLIVDTATVDFYGAIDLSASTLSSSPSAIEADQASTATIILQAKDTNGVSIPVGGEAGLTFQTTAGTLMGSVSDNANGTYTQLLQSSDTAGIATVSAYQGANPFSNTTNVEFYVANNLAGVTIDCSNIASYKNTSLVVSNGILTMNSRGSAGNCPEEFVFMSVIAKANGVITHSATTSDQEYGLEFETTYLEIAPTGAVNVSGKGYPQPSSYGFFRAQGNQEVQNILQNTDSRAGGSHGGSGATYNGPDFTILTYGSIFEPVTPGSSGGRYSGYSSRTGGGRVKITVAGTLLNNGEINADGLGYTSTGCGGAGGSIWIVTEALQGAGLISAEGGSGTGGAFIAGGGGRIAIYYGSSSGNFSLPSNIISNVSAAGGTSPASGNRMYAASGTVYLKSDSQTFGDLIINNKDRIITASSASKTIIRYPTPTPPTSLGSQTLTITGAFGDSYANATPFIGWYIDPAVNQNGTPVKADNLLFKVTSGSNNALMISSGNMTLVPGTPTDDAELVLVFDNFEIQGGARLESDAPILIYHGDLESGDDITAYVDGQPSSRIEFNGVQDTTFDLNGYTMAQAFGLNDFSGAVSFVNGTVALGDVTSGSFIATNAVITCDSLTTTSSGATLSGSTVTLGKPKGELAVDLSGTLSLASNSTLYQKATTPAGEYALEIVCDNLTIDASSKISATGRGYDGASVVTAGYFQGFGNYEYPDYTGSASSRCGGSHGGRGGYYSGNPMRTYGSFANPYSSGSSGSFYSTTGYNNDGGGIIRIDADTGDIIVNGTIEAEGQSQSGNYSNGAGGSILLIGGSVTGSGEISTDGGSSGNYGGGGGGRIAVYYTTLSGGLAIPSSGAHSKIHARGGDGYSTRDGASGTVFLKADTQTYGTLIIENNDIIPRSPALTSIFIPGGDISTGLTATELTAADDPFKDEIGFLTGHLTGLSVSPDTVGTGTGRLADDTIFRIISQSANTITTPGDMTTVADAGDSFQILLRLDEIRILGKAVVTTQGTILADSVEITGSLTGSGSLELNLASDTSINADTGVVQISYISGSSNLTLHNGTFTISDPALSSTGNITLQDGTFTLNDLVTTGSVNLSNGTFTFANLTGGSVAAASATVTGDGVTSTASGISLTGVSATLGKTRGVVSISSAGALSLSGTSTILQKATDSTTEYSLEINCGSLSIEAGSRLSATASGYDAQAVAANGYFRSYGNQDVLGLSASTSYSAAAGSHGGRGSDATGNHKSNQTYGSFANPYTSGSSGGRYSGGRNTDGGGIIRINAATGAVTVNGTIEADGEGLTGNYGNGAGGSIYIRGGTLSGSGEIHADGGKFGYYGGGGGGRVAVYYTALTGGLALPASGGHTKIHAWGGDVTEAAYAARDGGAGTLYLKADSSSFGVLIIDRNNLSAEDDTISRIVIPSSGVSTILSATELTANTDTFLEDGNFTGHIEGLSVNPNTSQNGTPQFADDTIFRVNSHTSTVLTTLGDMTSVASAGNTYEVLLRLYELRVVNGAYLDFSGRVLANKVELSGALYGSGHLELNSSDNITLDNSGKTLELSTVNASANLTLLDGIFNVSDTFYVSGDLTLDSAATLNAGEVTADGEILVDNGSTVTAGSVTAGDLLSLVGASFMTVDCVTANAGFGIDGSTLTASRENSLTSINDTPNVIVTGAFNVMNASTITTKSATASEEYFLYITATNMTIDATSSIDVDSKGYLRQTYRQFRTVGNIDEPGIDGYATPYGGASYGGLGGNYWSYRHSNSPYGNFREPLYLGSSGSDVAGSQGGGAVRVGVTGTFTLTGLVSSNGNTAASGGSIFVTTGTMAGFGSMIANGGDWANGGGSGGRIAIHYTTGEDNFSSAVGISAAMQAYGGTGNTDYRNGAAGTGFAKATGQTYGDLIVKNNSLVTSDARTTWILNTTVSTSSGLSTTTLSTAAGFDNQYHMQNMLSDFWVNPDINANGTDTLDDDFMVKVLTNTPSILNLASDPTVNGAQPGDPFRLVLILDNLAVINEGKLDLDNQNILVINGDMDGTPGTFDLSGQIWANVVDIGTDWSDNGAYDDNIVTVCADNGCPLAH